MSRASWMFCAALVACSVACAPDASFTKLLDPEPSVEDTARPPEPEGDTAAPPPPECPSTDGVSATSVERDATCRAEPNQEPMLIVTEWAVVAEDLSSHQYGTRQPAIGHLTDDNADGVFGSEGDAPDIVGVFYETDTGGYGATVTSGMVRVFSGAGDGGGKGLIHWEVSDLDAFDNDLEVSPYVHPAIGDIDADGEPEVVVGGWYGPENDDVLRLVALSHTGEVEWLSTISRELGAVRTFGREAKVAIFDLDQDGQPEVYAYGLVFDGNTGERIWDSIEGRPGDMVVTDLEGDGQHELITIDGIWEQDRTPRCRFESNADHLAIADLDDNGEGDVLLTLSGGKGMFWFDPACRSQRVWLQAGGRPTVADFDGDGKPEIGVYSEVSGIDHYTVYRPDGSEVWSEPVSIRYSGGGAVVFDFDADGYPELVSGVREPTIRAGIDGRYRLFPRTDSRASLATGGEAFALPVDVDGDEQVELVTFSAFQLMVVGDQYRSWPDARPTWNQQSHHRNHIQDDLTIPRYVPGNWPEYNDFNGVSTTPGLGQGANQVDAAVDLVHLCEVECDQGVVQVTLRMNNHGLRDAADGLVMAVYAEDDAGQRTWIDQIESTEQIRAGYTTAGLTLRIDLTDLPDRRVVFVADDTGDGTGLIEECDETNNEWTLEEICP